MLGNVSISLVNNSLKGTKGLYHYLPSGHTYSYLHSFLANLAPSKLRLSSDTCTHSNIISLQKRGVSHVSTGVYTENIILKGRIVCCCPYIFFYSFSYLCFLGISCSSPFSKEPFIIKIEIIKHQCPILSFFTCSS